MTDAGSIDSILERRIEQDRGDAAAPVSHRMTEACQQAFRHLFDGTVEQYDPWDAAYRTAGPQYPGTTMCSAFRTFQGWTALSGMARDQGVLHTVPIPGAMACLMLRPLLPDVLNQTGRRGLGLS